MARFDAVKYRHVNTEAVNTSLAEFLQWPAEDIGNVIGTNGKFLEGGIYMYDFDESARVCGAWISAPLRHRVQASRWSAISCLHHAASLS